MNRIEIMIEELDLLCFGFTHTESARFPEALVLLAHHILKCLEKSEGHKVKSLLTIVLTFLGTV